jgi:predicted metal-dependent phosphoesterase TrpH
MPKSIRSHSSATTSSCWVGNDLEGKGNTVFSGIVFVSYVSSTSLWQEKPRSQETKRDKGREAGLESIAASEIAFADAHFRNAMRRRSAWKIENYTYRECSHPDREFRSAVSLHSHSCHSVEKLAALNQVVKLAFMRPLTGVLQSSFGLGGVSNLNYAEVTFNPPYTPEDVYQMESAAAAQWGFNGVHLGLTDHDEFVGSLALLRRRPDLSGRIALSEELSVWYQGHLFHLGVSGLPESEIYETHARLQSAARGGRHDELFETLAASGCLVVLNHPLIAWTPGPETIPITDLLTRYGWAIHAIEVNGMRRREENDRVLELARQWRKPVVGGGDSHLLVASSILSLSQAASYRDFIAEVKDGHAVPFLTPDYFASLNWKLFLRVLFFMSRYRQIASYKGQPVATMLERRIVLLDPVGSVSRAFLALVSALGLAR